MSKVAVIGAGAYGTALGGVLAGNGYDIDYYDPLKEHERLKDVVSDTRVLLLSVPSDTITHLIPHLPKNIFTIVASKGFLTEKPFDDFKDWAVLAGAGFADDIKNGKSTRLTTTDLRAKEMFKTNHLEVELTNDRLGVLMCGALKNVYALNAGKLGIRPGTKKMKEYLFAAANEMGMILTANGANLSTLRLSCGVEDLALTCGLNSRNYSFGLELRLNPNAKPRATVEGVSVLKRIRQGEIIVPESAKMIQILLQG